MYHTARSAAPAPAPGRANNFNMARMLAAFMVTAGHHAIFTGRPGLSVCGIPLHALGLYIFFLIGGYLVGKSWMADRNVLRFAIKRLSRIWPPLLAALAVTVLILGPLVTTLSPAEWFRHPGVFQYFLRNALFFPIYGLPGVFEANIYPSAVNGSLWVLPVEMAMYAVVPVLYTVLGWVRDPRTRFSVCLVLTAAVCGLPLIQQRLFPAWAPVFYGTSITQALSIIPFFLIGVLFTFP